MHANFHPALRRIVRLGLERYSTRPPAAEPVDQMIARVIAKISCPPRPVETTPPRLCGIFTHYRPSDFYSRGRFREMDIAHLVRTGKLGRGGSANVYLACDPQAGNFPVVLKTYHTGLLRYAKLEGRAFERLVAYDCPNVVDVYGYSIDPSGRVVLVMEYLVGENLEQRIARSGPLTILETVDRFIEFAMGLDQVHRAGLLHLDPKPANFFLTRRGGVVTDLSIARAINSQGVVHTGTSVYGTTYYTSPEMWRSPQEITRAADIYSWGHSLSEALTGKSLVERLGIPDNLWEVSSWHAHSPASLPALGTDPGLLTRSTGIVSSQELHLLDEIVQKATARSVRDRYQDFSQVIADLKQWRASVTR
ncbi:MAG: serine/threonine protein kinase [Deltaproteobacteria bacterium]|nr:serine/threonine protein kinase [Deltaproteobacteria bacterium]